MEYENKPVDILAAGRMAESVLKNINGIDVDGYTSSELSAVIDCLFAVRAARLHEKLYGLAAKGD